jgi:hypothetical protein
MEIEQAQSGAGRSAGEMTRPPKGLDSSQITSNLIGLPYFMLKRYHNLWKTS